MRPLKLYEHPELKAEPEDVSLLTTICFVFTLPRTAQLEALYTIIRDKTTSRGDFIFYSVSLSAYTYLRLLTPRRIGSSGAPTCSCASESHPAHRLLVEEGR